jgi:HAMP domain-containing protein
MRTLWVTIVFLLIVSLAFLEVAAMRVEPATAPIEDARESPFPVP